MMQFLPFAHPFDTTSAATAGSGTVGNAARKAADAADTFAQLLGGVVERQGVRPDLFEGHGEAPSFGIWDSARPGINGLSSEAASGRLRAVSSRMENRISRMRSRTGSQDGSGTKSRAIEVLRSVKAGKGTGTTGLKEISDLKMDREDFVALKDALKEAGLSDTEIEALNQKIGSDAGLTWGAFVSALAGRLESLSGSGPASLSETETRDLQSLFQKMGFTPQEGQELLGQLRSGKSSSVWAAVSRKLQSLPADAAIDVDASELAALASAVQLSGQGTARLAALLGGQDKAALTCGQMAAVMTTLKTEVAADLEHATASGRELLDVVDEVLAKAVDRKFTAELASDRPDNDVRNQKILAQESRRERAQEQAGEASGGRGNSAAEASDHEGHAARVLGADPNNGSARAAAVAGEGRTGLKARAESKAEAAKDAGTPAQDARDAKAEEQAKLLRQGLADGESGARGSKDGEGAKDKSGADAGSAKSETARAWDALLGKVRVEGAQDVRTDAAVQQAANAESRGDNLDETLARLGKDVPSRMMRQVESGILRNMGQGRKQLTLNLEPADLGKLNVILQVKDKEVSAVLRAETQDAGRVLSEQLSQLKAHLEQQGLKVAKLEVQTQLQEQNQGHSWQGTEQHNLAQEQRNLLERQGIMRFLRQESVAAMSPEAQSEIETAAMARDGLYVVA